MLTEQKREREKFRIYLQVLTHSFQQWIDQIQKKKNEEVEDLSKVNQINLTDTYKTLQAKMENTRQVQMHTIFTKIDDTRGHKGSLNKW